MTTHNRDKVIAAAKLLRDEIAMLREHVTLLRDALEYHQSQTRPIQKTIDALADTEPKP